MRLGKFSGKLYEENEVENMKECGVVISEEQSKDEFFIRNMHMKDLAECVSCFGCPLSNEGSSIKTFRYFNNFPFSKALTHGGSFHADDVFSAALLTLLNPSIIIERSFNVPDDYDGIVFDVGGGKFDHHQPIVDIRENGIKYAAFGLLWREFGKELVSEEMVKYFDSSFVQFLDETDNTGAPNLLSSSIAAMNKDWDDFLSEDDDLFREAVELAITVLKKQILRLKARERGTTVVMNSLEASEGPIVYLEQLAPWKEILMETDKLFIVYPSNRGGYNAQVIPVSKECRLGRKDFPIEWAGLRDDELEKVSGIKDITFCHSSLFLCATKTKEAAYEACYAAMKI